MRTTGKNDGRGRSENTHNKRHELIKKPGSTRKSAGRKPRPGTDPEPPATKHRLIKKKGSATERQPAPFRERSSGSAKAPLRQRTGIRPAVKKTYQRDEGREDQRNTLLPGSRAVRLNKYIANAGVCSRRDADKLIESGVIKVNGKVVTELGTKIKPGDVVQYNDQRLKGETLRYVLLNKPKGFICTLDDPQERRTVMELVRNACEERIYPVGRLDRNTTGLLLLTNDGDLAKKLTHPRHHVRKVYQAELDKPLTRNDMIALADGVELEDGFIAPDAIAYAEKSEDKTKIGIEIHSGRNRIVRRMFEKFGYDVVKLDRVIFANLTKKDLPRGKWRHLTLTEINILRRVQ